jgi:hypothetical protein
LFKGFCTRRDRLEHGAFADFVAQAGGLQVFDDRLFPAAFRWVFYGKAPAFFSSLT